MIGIVVVSHSFALAQAVVGLANQMVAEDARPPIAVAAGLDEQTFGTDATAVMEAITQVDSPDGVLVFCDLGSAVLSAEMACEFLDPDVTEHVRLTSAPLVEGLVAAVVTAASGAPLDDVEREARAGLAGKQEHLGQNEGVPAAPSQFGDADATWTTAVTNPHGLHARPAAALVGALRGHDARVWIRNITASRGPVDATSLTQVASLGVDQGHEIEVSAAGPDAQGALDALHELSERGWDDEGAGEAAAPVPQSVTGPANVVSDELDLSGYLAGVEEADRVADALSTVDEHLASLAEGEPQAAIMGATRTLAHDPAIITAVAKEVRSGASALDAVTTSLDRIAEQFGGMSSDYLRERAQDVRSIKRMLLAALVGAPLTLPGLDRPGILVVDELDGATAAALDPAVTPGVIASRPGDRGHGAIIARAKGIAVATGRDITFISPGDEVTVT